MRTVIAMCAASICLSLECGFLSICMLSVTIVLAGVLDIIEILKKEDD